MKSLSLFSAAAAILLGSASPPPTDTVEARSTIPAAAAPVDPFAVETGSPSLAGAAAMAVADASDQAEAAPRQRIAPEPERKALASGLAASRAPSLRPAPVPSPAPAPAPVAAAGGVRIVVSIPEQKAYVFRGAALIATSPVSTGKPGHETPVGTFRILQKKVHHRSNRYSNAPMPYMQRLTNYGVALHAGRLPGYAASHGCIRLPRRFAKKLYGLTSTGTPVTVTSQRPKSAQDALSSA